MSISRLILAIVAMGLLGSGVVATAKPLPPPPPPSGCPAAGGSFPSVVFGRTVVSTNNSRSLDIYVGNSTGTCAVKVYSAQGANNLSMSYNIGVDGIPVGRIVWAQDERASKIAKPHSVVKLIQFHVNAATQSITDALPLTARSLYVDPSDTTAAGIYDENISPDGNSVVLTQKMSSQFELKLLDLSACTFSLCSPSASFTGVTYGGVVTGAVFGPGPGGANRIYFTAQKTGDVYGLYFLEKNVDGVWSERLVVSVADDIYPLPQDLSASMKIFLPSTAIIDRDYGGLGARDDYVVSFSTFRRDGAGVTIHAVDVLDVTQCTLVTPSTAGTGSCLANGASVVAHDFPGEVGSGGWRKEDGSILTMNNTGMSETAMWALDPLNPWGNVRTDYGLGLHPDGIK